MRQPTGQPMPMEAPPVAQSARWKEVTPPARMQMMEKLMAKLENPPMRLSNSCL